MIAAGRIVQVSTSPGGVPKRSVGSAEVNDLGLVGDRHRHPEFHGGPLAAVCLFSLERIRALQAEGHPIEPGSIGENVTLSGFPWERVVPGTRIHLGPAVILEVMSFTIPCATIAGSFLKRNIGRVLEKKHPGWSRVYCRVIQGGRISEGEEAQLHAPSATVRSG